MSVEEDQGVNPKASAMVGRNPDGTFAHGNPSGNNKTSKGRQPFNKRVDRFMGMSLNEVRQLLSQGDHLGQLSMWDAAAADAALAIFDQGEERQIRLKYLREVLDRCEGTPVQTVLTGTAPSITEADLEGITDEQAQAAYERLMKE